LELSLPQKKAMKTTHSLSFFRAWQVCRAGFTLTELLVIIAMLAVLACIQVSAFSGTKDQTRIAQCASNVRQLALASHI